MVKFRKITGHEIEGAEVGITLTADPNDAVNGNMSHYYVASCKESTGIYKSKHFAFQKGPVKEVGVNGITNELLLVIVIDRLEGAQAGDYACEENAEALSYAKQALASLHARTKKRLALGIEGRSIR